MENPLKRRIRRMVIYNLNYQKTLNVSLPGFNKVFSNKCSVLIRVIWLFLVVACLSLSLYQIAERWTYYRSEPIAVDVDVKEYDVMQFPVIALCSHHAEEIYNMFNEFGTLGHDKLIIETLILYSNLSVMDMWKIANTTLLLSSACIDKDKSVKVERNEIVTAEGTCLEFMIKNPMKYRSANQFLVNLRFKENITMFMYDKLMISEHPYPYYNPSTRSTLCSLKKSFKLSFQKFSYVNTRKRPCLKNEEFMQCRQRCINSKIKKLNCRFPFLKNDTNMPPCQEKGNNLHTLYKTAFYIQERTDPISACGCVKPCFETYIHIQSHVEERILNKTVYSFSFATNKITIIQERFIYTIIALLCDMGGMLGLYLGISILSIWEMLILSVLFKRGSSKTTDFAETDPIFIKVRSMIVKCSSTFPRHSSAAGKIFMLLIKIVCIVLSAWFFIIRTHKLLQDPTENTISFEHNTHVRYPSFILCQLAQSVREKMRFFAKKHKLKTWCDVEYLDLLDLPGVSVAWLWKNNSFANDLMEFEKLFGQKTVDYDMPDGRCYRIESVEVNYADSYLTYGVITNQLNFDPCHKDFIKVYVVNPGQRFDLFHYRNVPGRKGTEFRFQLKLADVSEVVPDCNDLTAEICKQNCQERRINGKLTCSLPFIPSSNQLPTCNNTIEAKKAKDIYIESFLGNTYDTCRCPRPCKTQIYETDLLTEPLPGDIPVTIAVFYFSLSATKSINARFSYQFLKYLCEIGSFLGLFLGLSILSVCELLESAFTGGYKKYHMRSKGAKNELSARIRKLAINVLKPTINLFKRE